METTDYSKMPFEEAVKHATDNLKMMRSDAEFKVAMAHGKPVDDVYMIDIDGNITPMNRTRKSVL